MDEIVPKPAQTDLIKNILEEVVEYKLEWLSINAHTMPK